MDAPTRKQKSPRKDLKSDFENFSQIISNRFTIFKEINLSFVFIHLALQNSDERQLPKSSGLEDIL